MLHLTSSYRLMAQSINTRTKWRARREVVNWLNRLVSKHRPPSAAASYDLTQAALLLCLHHRYSLVLPTEMLRMFYLIDQAKILKSKSVWGTEGSSPSEQCLGFKEFSFAGFTNLRSHPPDQMVQVPRKFNLRMSETVWSGEAWICCEQLKHYPAFCRNGTTIPVYSFVFIKAEEKSHYLGYLEDMYEDKKRWKSVKVISAECVDGPTTVLAPKHYEKCSAVLPQTFSSGIYLCSKQFINSKVKPFSLSKLRGYSKQAILSSLDHHLVSKLKSKKHKLNKEGEEDFTQETARTVPTNRKLEIKLSSKGALGIKLVTSEPQLQNLSFQVDEKIELLCQDSGIRGCWFRCKVLQASQKRLKVQYEDLEAVKGSGNIEGWVPQSRVAAPDKLDMRCPDLLTLRPWPPEDSSDCSFEVGAPVDAWWSNGCWEGVVVGTKTCGSDKFQVYSSGDDMFLICQRKNLRSSRDCNNKWVHIKAKPDILSIISSNEAPNMLNFKTCNS